MKRTSRPPFRWIRWLVSGPPPLIEMHLVDVLHHTHSLHFALTQPHPAPPKNAHNPNRSSSRLHRHSCSASSSWVPPSLASNSWQVNSSPPSYHPLAHFPPSRPLDLLFSFSLFWLTPSLLLEHSWRGPAPKWLRVLGFWPGSMTRSSHPHLYPFYQPHPDHQKRAGVAKGAKGWGQRVQCGAGLRSGSRGFRFKVRALL